MREFKHQNDPDTYWVECDQCECALEPYQQAHGLCTECRMGNYNQLADDCAAGLDDEQEEYNSDIKLDSEVIDND